MTLRLSCSVSLVLLVLVALPFSVKLETAVAGELSAPKKVNTDKILFLGNSITLHGPSEAIDWKGNWGMAASALDKDYVHRVVHGLAASKDALPKFMAENIADFERQYATYPVEEKLKRFADFKPSLVIVAIGENVPTLSTQGAKNQFYASMNKLLKTIQSYGNPTIVVRSCFWADAAKDQILKRVAADVGCIFVDISTLHKDESNFARSEHEFSHAGVAAHPGDRGMKAIADAIVEAIIKADAPQPK